MFSSVVDTFVDISWLSTTAFNSAWWMTKYAEHDKFFYLGDNNMFSLSLSAMYELTTSGILTFKDGYTCTVNKCKSESLLELCLVV